jgi:hypothetical protein
MDSRILRAMLGGVAVCALVAGCSGSSGGNPVPTTGNQNPTGSSGASSGGDDLPSHGAPKVQNPLDTTAFHQQPCRVLTADQLPVLGLDAPGEQRDGVGAPECNWNNRSTGASLGMQFELANSGGLSTLYERRAERDLWLELPPIEGFPAVAASARDSRSQGRCTVVVGVTDSLEFSVGATLSRAKQGQIDPCEPTQLAAKLILQTLKKGGA